MTMNLPKPQIDRETAMQLWISERSDYAKEQVILNNTGIIGFVLKSLKLNILDEDLQATGMVGLVKALDGFDAKKGTKFNTYATFVVRGEILHIFRKKRIEPTFSLDEPRKLESGDMVIYAEMIADEKRFEEEVIAGMQFEQMLDLLDEREKKVVFAKMQDKTQQQIAEMCGISQPRISKIIKDVCKKWRAKNEL